MSNGLGGISTQLQQLQQMRNYREQQRRLREKQAYDEARAAQQDELERMKFEEAKAAAEERKLNNARTARQKIMADLEMQWRHADRGIAQHQKILAGIGRSGYSYTDAEHKRILQAQLDDYIGRKYNPDGSLREPGMNADTFLDLIDPERRHINIRADVKSIINQWEATERDRPGTALGTGPRAMFWDEWARKHGRPSPASLEELNKSSQQMDEWNRLVRIHGDDRLRNEWYRARAREVGVPWSDESQQQPQETEHEYTLEELQQALKDAGRIPEYFEQKGPKLLEELVSSGAGLSPVKTGEHSYSNDPMDPEYARVMMERQQHEIRTRMNAMKQAQAMSPVAARPISDVVNRNPGLSDLAIDALSNDTFDSSLIGYMNRRRRAASPNVLPQPITNFQQVY